MRNVYVLGSGQSNFGRFKTTSAHALAEIAARAAIQDAGVDPRDIQAGYVGRVFDGNGTDTNVLMRVGITQVELADVENACASGSTAVHLLYKDIANGRYDLGIAIGCEQLSARKNGLLPPVEGNIYSAIGMSMPAITALIARRLMHEYGATAEDLAYASYKNHCNAELNPYAQYRKKFTIEEIVNSRMISDPITLLGCCPQSDGAAAVILCSEQVARKYTSHPIRMAASILTSAGFEQPGDDMLHYGVVPRATQMAYEQAGIGPEDLNLVELHDAFSSEELYLYEMLGLCRKGDGIAFARSGAAEIGGKVPVNPSGGLLALGHPLGASGTRVISEIVQHLKGQAGARQVEGAKVGLAHMQGGYTAGLTFPSICAVSILTL